jgi:hypothetical protein
VLQRVLAVTLKTERLVPALVVLATLGCAE